MHTLIARIATAAILLATARIASANLISDGSFETPLQPANAETSITGGSFVGPWNVVGNDILIIQAPGFETASGGITFNAQDGIQSCDLTGAGNTGLADGVTQSIATTPGATYTLSFFLGTALSNNGSSSYQTPATLDVSINGSALVPFTNTNTTVGFVNWQKFSLNFAAPTATTSIAFFDGETTNSFAGLDNVDVDPVPEPATLCLLALTLLAMTLRRRSRRI